MDAELNDDLPVTPKERPVGGVRRWLWWIVALIVLMVMVGGATRLTDSGLSITVWDPIVGTVPPLSDADWAKAFDSYKQTTEYQVQNKGMALSDFKYIFWWEWAHRLLGRLIGVVFAVPFIIFLAMGRLDGKLVLRLLVLLVLGGAQGALGWYMVKSGLEGRTDVSQYRLAAHLTLATLLLAATAWIALGIGRQRSWSWTYCFTPLLLLLLIVVQIAAGGFVAGLDAGHASYEWPRMAGAWIPDGITTLKPIWKNWLENALAVQFNHRTLAYIIFVVALLHAWSSFSLSAMMLLYGVFVQLALGIMMLWLKIPLGFALAHQAAAMVVLLLAVANLHAHMVNPAPAPGPQLYRPRLQSQ